MAKTILVADDSKTMQRVVEITFEKTGFEVVSVGTGHEALDRAPGLQPDIILADVAMPDADGYTLCTTLKQQATTAHIPVLLMGGGAHPVDVDKAMMAQADGHARKPYDSAELIHLVKQLTGVPVDGDVPMSFAAALARRQAPPPPAPPPVSFLGVSAPPPPPPPVAFAPPAQEPFAAPPAELPVMSDDIEVEEEVLIEDVEAMDEGALVAAGPSLEPPTPPSELGRRPHVDVWALAEQDDADTEAYDEIEEVEPQELSGDDLEQLPPEPAAPASAFTAPTRDIHGDDPTRDLRQQGFAIEALGAAAAPHVADVVAPAVPGLSRDELVALARQIIEQVAWEVVPELAETIIREELRRLVDE